MNNKSLEVQSSAIEKRKKWNFIARFTLSGVIFFVFFLLTLLAKGNPST